MEHLRDTGQQKKDNSALDNFAVEIRNHILTIFLITSYHLWHSVWLMMVRIMLSSLCFLEKCYDFVDYSEWKIQVILLVVDGTRALL